MLPNRTSHRSFLHVRTVLILVALLLTALAVRAQEGEGERWLNLPPEADHTETDPVLSAELLVNGGFEVGGNNQARNPRGWQFGGARQQGDRRVCRDGIASEGQCALRLMSNQRATRSLNQTLQFETPLGRAGDTLSFSADLRANALHPRLVLRVILTYADDSRQNVRIPVEGGSFAYTTISQHIPLQAPLKAVRARIVMNNARGTVWVDNLRLTYHPFDLPPEVTATSPADGAVGVLRNSPISVTFSKPVAAAPEAFALDCPAGIPVAFTVASPTTQTFTLTPLTVLPASTTCLVTVRADGITDLDAYDPPDNMTADYRFSFTTIAEDEPPTLLAISPPNAATDVPWDTDLVFSFSEPVNVQPGWLTLACENLSGGPYPIDVSQMSGNGTATLTVTPAAQLPVNAHCTGRVVATLVTDVDLNDPPDFLDLDFGFHFFTLDLPPQPSDDTYTVASNIGLNVPAPGVLANDDLNQGQISAPTPGVAFQTALGGTVRLRADGGFTYDPPAGLRATSDEFIYTVDNGASTSSARVTLNLLPGPVVWFIDVSAEAGGSGTLRAPLASIAAYNAVAGGATVQTGDVVFLHSGHYNGQGLILKNNQSVIGQGVALAALLPPLPEHSRALPDVGARPQVSTLFGAGVLLAQNNTLRGFDIGSTATYDLSGVNVGLLTVREMALNAGGGALNVSGGGTLDVVIDNLHGNGSGAINLVNTTGTLTVQNGMLTTAGGSALIVRGGAPTITYRGSITSISAEPLVDIANTTGGVIHLRDGDLLAVGGAVVLNNAADVRLADMQLTRRTPIFDDDGGYDDPDVPADDPTGSGISAVNSSLHLDNVTVTGFFSGGVALNFSGQNAAHTVAIRSSVFNGMTSGVALVTANAAQTCAQITDNQISGGGTGIHLMTDEGAPTLRLVGYDGAASDVPAISGMLTAQNTLTDMGIQITVTTGQIVGVANCAG